MSCKHLDYSIDSRISRACIRSIGSDSALCTGSRFFSQGREPEVEGQRWRLSSEITASKSAIVHLVCVIIMYIIYEMYKDEASLCTPSFLNAEAVFGCVRNSILPYYVRFFRMSETLV